MPTPAIQTLINDAQQVLNLDSISAVRSVVAVSLANANTGTPLNPNLTTQQLWNEFYQVVTRSKSDIESIIANQLMKFLYSPPAPGGVGANKQVIFNDGGVLAGDAGLTYDKATDSLTISGDLTVDTSTLKVTASTDTVTVGATTTDAKFRVVDANYNGLRIGFFPGTLNYNLYDATVHEFRTASVTPQQLYTLQASSSVWYDGLGGTRMTLNSTGLNIANGNVILGTSGKGIDFSATASGSGTMTSELLNDYEEGTWTGTLRGVTDPTTPVTATGRYTKIGRVVTVQISFEGVDTTGASGAVYISGLPFSTTSTTRNFGSGGVYSGATFTGTLAVYSGTSSLNLEFQSIISNAPWAAATHNAGANRYFWASLTYTV